MGTADKLVDLMFRWMEKRERCAEQLRELARELEVLRKKCNGSQCVGNSVSVVGAASLLGAGVATLCTGGLAAPFLGLLGAAYTVVGLTISGVTQLTEYLSSSERTKKAESIESESKRIAEEIDDLFEQLKAECKAESVNADEDELDQLVMAKLPAAIARRNDQKWTVCDSIKRSSSSGPQFSENAPLLNQKQNAFKVGLASVLVVFAFKASGKKAKLLVAEAGKQLIKKIGCTASKVGRTALKAGGLVVGVVGLAFALHDAIDSWKKMIKNNHATEASQSLRDTADSLDEICRMLMIQLEDINIRSNNTPTYPHTV
ncbi:uncharacterized protein LOC117487175 [Trematomus bernacchii]|uniref:uncharacterized protein LOC117487175 n=1 Tax=Trematomus bernacchii TaxID=40690 RepID=UPI00146B9A15|nr:uncharacterized protein LOC117487175 [Trematomus bernacchii]